jgi:hypothetical protein
MDLTWHREPGGDWILLHKRRRMGRVVPDSKYPGMYRIALSRGRLSDMANLSWAKSLALEAAERELAYERANTPQKPQQKRGSFKHKSSPIRQNQLGATAAPAQEKA